MRRAVSRSTPGWAVSERQFLNCSPNLFNDDASLKNVIGTHQIYTGETCSIANGLLNLVKYIRLLATRTLRRKRCYEESCFHRPTWKE
jgi:arginine deiminase